MAKVEKKELSDYRNVKYLNKETITSIIKACGENVPANLKKDELVELAKQAQQKVINHCGKLFDGEY